MTEMKSNPMEALPADRSSALVELIEVAEGAVVSRVLAKSGGGNVTLFAFDRNQGLSEHTAPFDALVQVVDGSLELTIGGTGVTVGPGEIVRMPAGVPHALHAPEPCRMALTMLREFVKEG
jgi:quercetin dioxygenase-like cupin family protein